MKRFFLAMMMLLCSAFLQAQNNEQSDLKKVLDNFLMAIKNNNDGIAGSLLTDDYKLYGGFVCIKNKSDRLANLKGGQIKYELHNTEASKKFTVNQYGADIQLNALLKYTACTQDGKEVTIQNCPVLLHFVKHDGNWRISSECLGGGCLH